MDTLVLLQPILVTKSLTANGAREWALVGVLATDMTHECTGRCECLLAHFALVGFCSTVRALVLAK